MLEKLAASETDPARAQVAWLLAARSAALGGTPQSKEQALILFDKAIETKGTVSSLANLEKARHLIDMYRLAGSLRVSPEVDQIAARGRPAATARRAAAR